MSMCIHSMINITPAVPCSAGFFAISVTVRFSALKNEPLTGVDAGVA